MAIPVIFEGTDKGGKTRTLDAVRALRPDWIQYIRPKQVKDTKPVDGIAEAIDQNQRILEDIRGLAIATHAVVDRIPHFSEIAYGQAVDGKDHLADPERLADWYRFDEALLQAGAILVYCYAAPRQIELRWNRDPDPYMMLEHIRPLQHRYLELLTMSKLPAVVVNTGVSTPEYAAMGVVNFIEKGMKRYAGSGNRPSYAVGSLQHHYGISFGLDPFGTLRT